MCDSTVYRCSVMIDTYTHAQDIILKLLIGTCMHLLRSRLTTNRQRLALCT